MIYDEFGGNEDYMGGPCIRFRPSRAYHLMHDKRKEDGKDAYTWGRVPLDSAEWSAEVEKIKGWYYKR